MKRRYWIALVVCIIFIFGILAIGYRNNRTMVKEKNQDEILLATRGEASKESYFYLSELNGYVVVYLEDRSTIYEYTNIAVAELPERVKDEITNGKKIKSVQELYGFLENYSS